MYNKENDYLLYRMSHDSVDAFNKLDEITQYYKDKTGYPPSTFMPDLRAEFITNDAGYVYNLSIGRKTLLYDRTIFSSFREEQICDLYAALTKGNNLKGYSYISNIISNQSLKYLLINSNQAKEATEEIEKCCKLEYQNSSYRLYSCNQAK